MKVALVGNPNSGKTSIFNHLTGLNQKVGNYPGITVDKKIGKLSGSKDITVLDLPGTYSIYAKSRDEEVVTKVLGDKSHPDHPDSGSGSAGHHQPATQPPALLTNPRHGLAHHHGAEYDGSGGEKRARTRCK